MKVIVQHAEIDKKNQKNRLGFEHTLLSLCASGTIVVLALILKLSNYGIDLADEDFYLVWIANPYLYNWPVIQFSCVYHFLYLMLGGDIASLGQVNIFITFWLSWSLAKHLRSNWCSRYRRYQNKARDVRTLSLCTTYGK